MRSRGSAPASIEFYLARITAQARGFEPSISPGTKPTITEADIRTALSLATNPLEFHALMAKYCADPLSERAILIHTRHSSGLRFLEHYPDRPISGAVNQAIAESAVLYFVSPTLGLKRGDVGNAAHAGVARNTWTKHYRDHFNRVTADLFEIERRGLLGVWRILK